MVSMSSIPHDIANRLEYTTEALIDILLDCVVRVKNNSDERKYLTGVSALISNWSGKQNHVFTFELSDILSVRQVSGDANIVYVGDRIASGLIELKTTPSTLNRVLHEVLKRLFAMASASWFYKSAGEEIEARLVP